MPKFGKKSKKQLSTCNKKLQEVFNEVIKTVDCSVLEGHRGENRQNALYKEGKTKVKFPKGRHNHNPSLAVDVVPYPIDCAGFVLGVANQMGIPIRWGGDWNQNWEVDDNQFDDFPHFELVVAY